MVSDDPFVRIDDHADKKLDDFIVRLIKTISLIARHITTLERELQPNLGFGSLTLRVRKFGDE